MFFSASSRMADHVDDDVSPPRRGAGSLNSHGLDPANDCAQAQGCGTKRRYGRGARHPCG